MILELFNEAGAKVAEIDVEGMSVSEVVLIMRIQRILNRIGRVKYDKNYR